MKIVIAMDSFKGSLTAEQAAECVDAGIRRVLPDCETVKIPMADGGEGTGAVLTGALGGKRFGVTVRNPLGKEIIAEYGIAGNTAVMEMAEAGGLCLLSPDERNPLPANTYGVGQMILDALGRGCRRILIGIGGSATNDGGAGMAAALGVRFTDKEGNAFIPTGGTLSYIEGIDTGSLDPRVRDTEFVVACDVTNPIVGKDGASRMFAPQKGASPEDVELLEENMAHYVGVIRERLGTDVSALPGGGAAGGLGAGLTVFCGAKIRRGFDMVADAVGLDKKIQSADLVFTGEGRTDEQTAYGKLPAGVAAICRAHGVPCFLVSGAVTGDMTELYRVGVTAAFGAVTSVVPLDEAMKHAKRNLTAAAENVMRAYLAGHAMKRGI